MILDYSNYLTQSGGYGMNTQQSNRELFFDKRGFCQFCKENTQKVHHHSEVDTSTLPKLDWHKVEEVWECELCGWWEYLFYSYMEGEQSWGMKDWELSINSATLKKFDIGSNSIPIDTLQKYIQNNNDEIFQIHHKKMEELVGSVFKNHYNCDVHHVGKSSDGGRDLILIESDKPTIVQIKRRTTKDKTESVKEIRDLLGATLLSDSRNSIFVTTANHFSKQAIEAADTAVTKKIVDSFQLYDFDKFMNVLNLQKMNDTKIWSSMIKFSH